MDGIRSFDYDSVYFDTPQLDSYLLAARGRRLRFKIRTRTYVDSSLSFMEVKTGSGREATVNERIPYSVHDRSRITAEGLDYVNETLSAIGDIPSGPLEPVLETGGTAQVTAGLGEGALDGAQKQGTVTAGEYTAARGPGGR